MKLQYFIIGFLLASGLIAGTTLMIAELSVQTGITVNTSYNETYNKIDDFLNLTNETTSTLQGSDVESTEFQALQLASFPVLRIVLNSYDIFITLMNDMADDLNLPTWILTVILGIVAILLLFAVLAALFGRRV